MTSVKFNKIVTVIEDANDMCRVFSFKSKAAFWTWADTQDKFDITVNMAHKKTVTKLEKLGFKINFLKWIDEDRVQMEVEKR